MPEFQLRDVSKDISHIIPGTVRSVDIESARKECESTAERLSERMSGYGKLPAERYLLRFEYGFKGKELKDAYNVTLSTISTQTMGVRREILKFPALARIVGQSRGRRAELERPALSDTTLLNEKIKLRGQSIDTTVELHLGDATCTYSWMYRLRGTRKRNKSQKNVLIDYLVDAEYGVLLKRMMEGTSELLGSREPVYDDKRLYVVYSLPHQSVPKNDGTLNEAIEYHAAKDLDEILNLNSWDDLKSNTGTNRHENTRLPEYANRNILLERLQLSPSLDPISEYSEEKHLRDNLEHLLRVYPMEQIKDIPSGTIDILWNGPAEEQSQDGNAHTAVSTALETSEVKRMTFNKGY